MVGNNDVTSDVTMAIMAAQLKNARLYEYLMGALLEPEDRTRELRGMLNYKKKTAEYLENIDGNAGEKTPAENTSLLQTEVDVNKKLIDSVRNCEIELWVQHGYGLPIKHCTSKWVYQDFPDILGRQRSVHQPLYILCKHVQEKYDCSRDHIIAERLENDTGESPDHNLKVSESVSREDDSNERNNTNDLIDSSDDEENLVVAEQASYPRVTRDMRDINNNDILDEISKASSLVMATKAASNEATPKERVLNLKNTIQEALGRMTTTLVTSSSTHLGEDTSVTPMTAYDSESVENTVSYWPQDTETTSVSTTSSATSTWNTLCDNVRKYAVTKNTGLVSRKLLARQLPKVVGAEMTPLDPEYGTSPCGVKASRMTPLRAPVKKAKRSVAEIHLEEEEERNDLPPEDLGPYHTVNHKNRVSHVQGILGSGEGPFDRYMSLQAQLDLVRQRVVKRMLDTEDKTTGKRAKTKEKKRKRKSKCRRKCKKHPNSDASETSSSESKPSKSEAENSDVTSNLVEADVTSRKDKKRKRRHQKKEKRRSVSC